MICLMHEGNPYGHLKVNSKVIDSSILARMVGESKDQISDWLSELQHAGVFEINGDGCVFSRRMVRDEAMRNIRAEGGKLGGNPKLVEGYNKPGFLYLARRSADGRVKIGISQQPSKRIYKIRAQFPDQDVALIDQAYVADMGASESELHKRYANCASGEWFALSADQLSDLMNHMVHLKGNLKVNQTPASSSSSSSAKKNQKQKIRAARSANFTAKDLIDQHGVDKRVAEDFLETRKAKRLANTPTALDGLIREFTLANLLVADGIRLCTEKGWGGFNHKWPTDGGSNGTGNQGSSPGPMSAPDRVRAAIAARETGSAEGGRTLEHQ